MITAIAEAHGKSATQIVLRWHIRLGLVAIPRSARPSNCSECQYLRLELDKQEVSAISALDRGEAGLLDSDVFDH